MMELGGWKSYEMVLRYAHLAQVLGLIGAPGEIRTPGLLVRSQALYPTELRAQRRHCSNIARR
jgi:hypothetical protein